MTSYGGEGVTDNPPEPIRRGGPSGGCAFAVAAFGLLLAWLLSLPAQVRDGSGRPLIVRVVWAVIMTMALGVALASIRRGPAFGREAAYLALAICLIGIGWVAVELVRVILR